MKRDNINNHPPPHGIDDGPKDQTEGKACVLSQGEVVIKHKINPVQDAVAIHSTEERAHGTAFMTTKVEKRASSGETSGAQSYCN